MRHKQGVLETYKKDYFKMNASPKSGDGSVRGSAFVSGKMSSIATTRKPLERATSEVIREDGWPDAAWPDFLGHQHQL